MPTLGYVLEVKEEMDVFCGDRDLKTKKEFIRNVFKTCPIVIQRVLAQNEALHSRKSVVYLQRLSEIPFLMASEEFIII
jgi:hypothetical protein